MGVLTIYSDSNADSTVISNIFIDEYMRDANDAQLKVYLYLLRSMSAGRVTSIRELADRFNHTEVEVMRSLLYWEGKGLIALQRDKAGSILSIHLCTPKSTAAPAALSDTIRMDMPLARASHAASVSVKEAQAPQPKAAPAPAPAPAPAAAETAPKAAAKTTEDERAELLFIVEQYIGKPLSVSEMNTVYYILEDLHFSGDLLDYLFQYCVGMNKRDFKYIQKVAMNWAEKGITTVRQAEKDVENRPKRKGSSRNPESVHHFQQNQYDFDALEAQLLSN